MSHVLDTVLEFEQHRGMDFASPLLWALIWHAAMARAVSVRAVRVFSGMSSSGTLDAIKPVDDSSAAGVHPAEVVARETRELFSFRRAIYAIRRWWVANPEARVSRTLFEQVFHDIGFPGEHKSGFALNAIGFAD